MKKFPLSSSLLILLTAIGIVIANNGLFFAKLNQRLDLLSLQGAGFLVAFYSLVIFIVFTVMRLLGQRFLVKPVLIFFTLLSAVIGYFTNQLGVIFDTDMILNVVETVRDNNHQEGLELLSISLFWHVFLYGILPSIVVVLVEILHSPRLINDFLQQFFYFLSLFGLTFILILMNFKYVTYFGRENRDLRVYITPTYAIKSAFKFIDDARQTAETSFTVLGEDAVQTKSGQHKRVGILVVGETARADHFSLNGYAVTTNPLLQKQDIINFSQVSSCGTSTAYSVPCMFSFFGKEQFSTNAARKTSNVLDVLHQAGIKVLWKDNNSSCKDVCNRIDNINLTQNQDSQSKYFNNGDYFDEVLLENLDEYIDNSSTDVLIVLHTLGSHGPAYYKRYPDEFARFKPFCKSQAPQECSRQEIINAYDNTILYTDYVLNQIIEFLQQRTTQYESFMLYVSDHGESLGENGIYLHGLPYMLAPKEQTHIPMIFWQSTPKGIRSDSSFSNADYSHDNIPHTLLGLFNVRTSVYQAELDIFRSPAQLR